MHPLALMYPLAHTTRTHPNSGLQVLDGGVDDGLAYVPQGGRQGEGDVTFPGLSEKGEPLSPGGDEALQHGQPACSKCLCVTSQFQPDFIKVDFHSLSYSALLLCECITSPNRQGQSK